MLSHVITNNKSPPKCFELDSASCKASRSPKFRATGSHGRTAFRGGPPVTICLLCACALLLLASGIESNPGPDTPRVPTPCDDTEPLVTPQRRSTAKSASDDAGVAHPVNCIQCHQSPPDQSTINFYLLPLAI